MANNTSQHILGTAGNLLGFCLIVMTSLRIADRTEMHLLDEFTSIIAVVLTCSCIFSFVSIRTSNADKEKKLESVAEYLFILSLVGILLIILLITLNFLT
jgi:hypothetical protein